MIHRSILSCVDLEGKVVEVFDGKVLDRAKDDITWSSCIQLGSHPSLFSFDLIPLFHYPAEKTLVHAVS